MRISTQATLPSVTVRNGALLRWWPDARLRPWVEYYWLYQPRLQPDPPAENFYPDGGVSLMFTLDGGHHSSDFEGIFCDPPLFSEASFNGASLSGTSIIGAGFSGSLRERRRSATVRTPQIGIRFQPGGAGQLLRVPFAAVKDAELSGDLFGLPEVASLAADLATNTESLASLFDRWLLAQAAARQVTLTPLQRLIPVIRATGSDVFVTAARLGLTRRTLERRCQEEIGISPLRLNRLWRMKQARLLLTRPELSLSEVALQCGFHDQSHFTHHFRRHTDETPAAYRRRKLTQIYNSAASG